MKLPIAALSGSQSRIPRRLSVSLTVYIIRLFSAYFNDR